MSKVSSTQYIGHAGVADGTLADAIRGVAQTLAARAASTVADFTADNSGGTPGGTIADVPTITPSVVTGTNAIAKTEAEAAFAGVVDGLSEVIAKCNAIRAVIPNAFGQLVDNTGGAAADGTIAAITVAGTGVNAAMASGAGADAVVRTLRSRIAQVAFYVNKVATAAGADTLAVVMPNNRLYGEWGLSFAAVSTDTGATTDGSEADAANGVLLKDEFDAAMTSMANAVASMAAKLDAITDDANATFTCPVVAV